MVSDEFLRRYAHERVRQAYEAAARAWLVPSFRARLALKVHALARWLGPTLEVPPVAARGRVLERAAEG